MKKALICGFILIAPAIVLLRWHATRPAYRLQLIATDRTGGGDGAISPDGTRFVISSKRGGNWDLWEYDLKTLKWTQLTDDPADDFEGRFSPDGNRVAFCSTRKGQKNIWILSLATRAVSQLTFAKDDEEYPAWSPDGKQIVYTSGPWAARDYYVISAEGGTPRRISRQSGLAGACMFEPRGDSLICHRYELGSGNLVRVWLDSGEMSPLTIGTENWDYKPSTSPDNHWIAFSRSTEGPSHIWLMPAEGGRPRPLTETPDDDRWPTWNAAGDRLFFHRLVDRGTAIKILDRETGKIRTVVGESEHPLQASFDPEAKRIVYARQLDNRKVLEILDLQNGTTRILDTGSTETNFPRWSPDGQRIAFVVRQQQRREVGVIKSDGSGMTILTSGDPKLHGIDGAIDWSPDNSKIVFHADTRPFEALLYTADLKTGHIEAVTSGAWFDEAPSWTPDGKGIIFMSTRGGNWTWGLFRMSLRDGTVTSFAGPDWVEKNFPRMAVSGFTVWSVHDEHDSEMLAERSASGKIEVLSAAGPGARWPSYSADGKLLLFTTIAHQVEYWLAENVLSAGSPAAGSGPRSVAESDPPFSAEPEGCKARLGIASLRRSPVDMFHR